MRCNAKTRKGTPCQARGFGKGGRCKFHGGASTGPRTPEGKARALAAARAGFERWKAKQSPGVIDELALPDLKGLELPELPGLELPDMPGFDELPDNANRCDKIL